MANEPKWYQSKTKWAGLIGGLSLLLGTVAGFLNGNVDAFNAMQALALEISGVLAIFGIRDLPILNVKK